MIAILGLILGFMGTALGIFNAWRSYHRDQVSLKVTQGMDYDPHSGTRLTIIVANTGAVAVDLTFVGFTLRGSGEMQESMSMLRQDEPPIPCRLEPLSEAKFRSSSLRLFNCNPSRLIAPYVVVAGGKRVYGEPNGHLIKAVCEAYEREKII